MYLKTIITIFLMLTLFSCNKVSVTHGDSIALDQRTGDYYRMTSIYNFELGSREFFISKTSKENTILNYRFIRGLDHPTEIVLDQNLLHITDGSQVKIADLRTGKIMRTIPINEKSSLSAL